MMGRSSAIQHTRAVEAQAPARRDELFDRLLHDLRNPVGVMAYYAEAVSGAGAQERDEMCERLRVNGKRALHVLEEFSLLAELRGGRGRLAAEDCDLVEVTAELAADLEALDRRPGRIQRDIALPGPLRIAPLHIRCALRPLLRIALRVASSDDTVRLDAGRERHQLLVRIAVPLRSDPEMGIVAKLPSAGIEIELAERIATLYEGRYMLAQDPGVGVMTLALTV